MGLPATRRISFTRNPKERRLYKVSYVTCRMALAGGSVLRVPSRSPSLRGNEKEPVGKAFNVFQHRGLLRRASRE